MQGGYAERGQTVGVRADPGNFLNSLLGVGPRRPEPLTAIGTDILRKLARHAPHKRPLFALELSICAYLVRVGGICSLCLLGLSDFWKRLRLIPGSANLIPGLVAENSRLACHGRSSASHWSASLF